MSYTFVPATRFTLPRTRCCNCGAALGFSEVEVEAPVGGRGMPDGERVAIVLRLPFCKQCAPTARRFPPEWTVLVLLGFLLSVGFSVGLFALKRSLGLQIDELVLLVTAWTLGFALPFVARTMPQARPPQTSWFAPVRLENTSVSFLGSEVQRLSFAFTNERYAAEFSHANAESIKAGGVKVRVAKR